MTINIFSSALFEISVNAHISHLQSKSYAEHIALGDLYSTITDLLDNFIETYQGAYGEIVKNYSDIKIKEGINFPSYLEEHVSNFRKYHSLLSNSELQQIIDDIIELINKTIYKLKFLK